MLRVVTYFNLDNKNFTSVVVMCCWGEESARTSIVGPTDHEHSVLGTSEPHKFIRVEHGQPKSADIWRIWMAEILHVVFWKTNLEQFERWILAMPNFRGFYGRRRIQLFSNFLFVPLYSLRPQLWSVSHRLIINYYSTLLGEGIPYSFVP